MKKKRKEKSLIDSMRGTSNTTKIVSGYYHRSYKTKKEMIPRRKKAQKNNLLVLQECKTTML